MLKEGMFIQERYEIISRLGSGGMADVYKAKDHKLNRFVAVKVLKPEFRDDTVFISKFRIEAQSAAGLSHPNIVNVYDVGEDADISFIVMELVEGITLKEYINKKGRLAVREATSIAMQVCMGLEAAHKNNIVHRDVKPQNIIISTDGKVKVTDFGIARAATANTINSSVMGSVHYSSPEQARGGYSDYKSDIYSMGITLYEMLTGTVPFDGDSTVAIAIKHLQEELPSPRKYVPDLPKSTVQIIYKCTQKSPDRRYNDMGELIADLKESLVNPEGDFVKLVPMNSNAQTVVISDEELNQIRQSYGEAPQGGSFDHSQQTQQMPPQGGYPGGMQGGYGGPGYPQGGGYPNQGQRGAYQGYPPQGNPNIGGYGNPYPQGYFDPDDDEDDEGLSPRLEKAMVLGSIVAGVIILAIIVVLVGNATGLFDMSFLNRSETESESLVTTESQAETESDVPETTSDSVEVPSVIGKTESEALEELNALSIGGKKVGEQPSAEYAAGQIISQTPAGGSSVQKNTMITYVVSSGSESTQVPEVAGRALSDVEAELDRMGVNYEVNYTNNPVVETGQVIYAEPQAGSEIQTGDTVVLWVNGTEGDTGESSTESTSGVKDYTGEWAIDALDALNKQGYKVEYVWQHVTDTDQVGMVLSQDKSGEGIAAGSTITLTVGDIATSNSDGTSSGESQTETGTSTGETESETASAAGAASNSGTGEEYVCSFRLDVQEYNGYPVRIVLEQDGVEVTLVDDEEASFPYDLEWSSDSNSLGTAYVYIMDPDTGEVITSFKSREPIAFTAADQETSE